MKKTSEVKDFPFLIDGINYYELYNNDLIDLGHDKVLIENAYSRAKNDLSKLYVIWHGIHSTDLFIVDDLYALGQAYGFEKPTHIHDIEWKYYEEDSRGGYVTLNIKLKCGCCFDGVGSIQRLKNDLFIQKGWEMSKSYMGGYKGNYTIRVLKNSIKE